MQWDLSFQQSVRDQILSFDAVIGISKFKSGLPIRLFTSMRLFTQYIGEGSGVAVVRRKWWEPRHNALLPPNLIHNQLKSKEKEIERNEDNHRVCMYLLTQIGAKVWGDSKHTSKQYLCVTLIGIHWGMMTSINTTGMFYSAESLHIYLM